MLVYYCCLSSTIAYLCVFFFFSFLFSCDYMRNEHEQIPRFVIWHTCRERVSLFLISKRPVFRIVQMFEYINEKTQTNCDIYENMRKYVVFIKEGKINVFLMRIRLQIIDINWFVWHSKPIWTFGLETSENKCDLWNSSPRF